MRTMIYNRDFTLPELWSQEIPDDVGTIILSNGSKWGGQEADDVPALLERLANHPVREDFDAPYFHDGKDYVHFPGFTNFFGNFAGVSGVFSIETRDPEVLATLKAACLANVAKYRPTATV